MQFHLGAQFAAHGEGALTAAQMALEIAPKFCYRLKIPALPIRFADRHYRWRVHEYCLSILVIRPLLGSPITVNDIPAGTTSHVPLDGVADKIRWVLAATLSPDRGMIANNDQGDVMPLTPTAELYAAI